jgi:hypothetical protein
VKVRRSRHAETWWQSDAEKVHEKLIPYVRTVERRQSDYFDRFLVYEAHYDPNGPAAEQTVGAYQKRLRGIKENVVATGVDTVRATIAATEIYARFQTEGGDWSTQRRAELLEQYVDELAKRTKVAAACRAAFFACAKKGVGVVRVYADQDKCVRVEPFPVDDIVVDDRECAHGATPRQIHFRTVDYDCDHLMQQFPEHEEAIYKARSGPQSMAARRTRGGDLGETRNDVLVIESIRLPMGVKPDGWEEMSAKEKEASRYVPGRHVICIEGRDLLDEEWHKPHFGIAVCRYFEREGSWYGGSLTERILRHQVVLDRRNHQRDRQLDYAVPTTFVSWVDQKIAVQQTQAGNVIPYKGDKPVTTVPQVIGSEIREDRLDARASAIAEIGLSEMATRGVKPPGLESGAALREHKDQNSQRFSMQEKEFENLWLETDLLLLDVCRDLGNDAPEMSRQTKFGPVRIPWGSVDMDDVRVMIAAASTLARTPAGRVQTVLELSQAGAITLDETRKLLDHPDLDRTGSLYAATIEAIEYDLESIRSGKPVLPDPFAINLEIAQVYAQRQFALDRNAGAPEEVLEGLRAYGVQAADFLSRAAANTNAAPPMLAAGVPQPLPDPSMGGAMPPGMPMPPMAEPQQVPSAGPPILPAASGPVAA